MNIGPALFIALAAALYAVAFGSIRPRQRPPRWRAFTYIGGLAVLGLSLASPLDALSGDLFAAHMVQHMLLAILAPPLIALGQPLHVLLLAAPDGWRRGIARWLAAPSWQGVLLTVLAHPVALVLTVNVPLVVWHIPWIYEAALYSRLVHDLEHLTFLVPPVMLWLVLFEPTVPRDRRPSIEGALMVLFATWMVCDLLGATLALSGTAWYGAYADTLRWGLSAQEDQRLGGLVMWIGGGVFYGAAMLALLVRAFAEQRQRARRLARS